MDEMGETCKLCLKYIQGDSVAALDDDLLTKLDFIQMNLERSVEESNSVCTECKEKIENAFDFKFCLVQSESFDSGASGSQAQNLCDIPSTSSGESSTEKTICRLCKNSVAVISVIGLEKLLKDDNVMEVFQGHISEMEFKESENSMVCEPCQKSLASFSMLVSSWSIANDWNEDDDMKEDMNNFGAVEVKQVDGDEFSDSNTNSSCAVDTSDSGKIVKKAKGNRGQITKVKTETDEVSDSNASVSMDNKDVKKEENEEEDEEADLQLKDEEIDIKDEDGYWQKTLTLHELMAEIENLDDISLIPDTISIFPPCDGNETDEDSGDETTVHINNLSGNQRRAEAEASFDNDDVVEDMDSEGPSNNNSNGDYDRDDLPLSSFLQSKRQQLLRSKKSKPNFTWKKANINNTFSAWQKMQGPINSFTPLELFFLFIDDEIINLITDFTNLYASHHNRVGDVTTNEIKCFIGVLLLSGYNTFPRRTMYWENAVDAGSKLVYTAISRDRFSFIMQNLHFNDNTNLNKEDKFSKLRPLFHALNKKFQMFAPFEEFHSVDESMVPYYGGHGTMQFIRGKPIRWGYKLWAGTTRQGYIEWFEPYQGSTTQLPEKYRHLGLGASVVLQFADVLQSKFNNVPYHIFCDNFFTSINLLIELEGRGMKCTGTIRENRLLNCPLKKSKVLSKESRGSFDYSSILDENIIVCKWNDNNVVTIASNVSSTFTTTSVKRYSQKEKKNIYIEQPHLIKMYSENMGGVDQADQNISLYRVSIRGKKWYSSLFSHCLDMAEHNAWQLHKLNGGKMDHLAFRRYISSGLLETFRKTTKRGPSKQSKYYRMESRFDKLDHLIIYQEKQTRCGYCHKLAAFRCNKCDIALHPKQCFFEYHTKE